MTDSKHFDVYFQVLTTMNLVNRAILQQSFTNMSELVLTQASSNHLKYSKIWGQDLVNKILKKIKLANWWILSKDPI